MVLYFKLDCIRDLSYSPRNHLKAAAIEIKRVLKTNGIIFITVPIFNHNAKKEKNKKENGNWKLKKIEKGTFIPLTGPEKGLPHHFFTEREIYKVFKDFDIKENYIDRTKHRAFIGFKKN